jgi:uncharacterized membrane protein YfcA
MHQLTATLIVELVIIGLITGTLAGMLGAGGGFVTVPLLVAVGLNVHVAVSLSLAYVVVVAASGVLRHLRQGTIDLPLGLILVAPGIVAAQVGSQLSHRLPSRALELLVALLLVAVLGFFASVRAPMHEAPAAAALPRGPGAQRALAERRLLGIERMRMVSGRVYRYTVSVPRAVVIGASVGLVSGLFGVGGGFILVPLLVGVIHAPMQVAVGSDLVAIMGNGVSGAIGHVIAGDIHVGAILRLGIPLISGGVVGSQLGARACTIFSQARLRLIFNVLLVSATLYMGGAGLGLINAVSSKG